MRTGQGIRIRFIGKYIGILVRFCFNMLCRHHVLRR